MWVQLVTLVVADAGCYRRAGCIGERALSSSDPASSADVSAMSAMNALIALSQNCTACECTQQKIAHR
jgi:hypothetical protein